MKKIVFKSDTDTSEIFKQSQNASSEMANRYFQKYLQAASDDQIGVVLKRNHKVLLAFEDRADLCVGYYLGNADLAHSEVSAKFMEAESNMKADTISDAINNPSAPMQAGNVDEISKIIARGYYEKEYGLEEFAKLNAIHCLNARESCSAAIKFADVLALFDTKTGAFVFKSLLRLANAGVQE